MTPKSVKKKLKQPSFAAAVNREDLRRGAAELGVEFDEHLSVVIGALAERQQELLGSGATPSAEVDTARSAGTPTA